VTRKGKQRDGLIAANGSLYLTLVDGKVAYMAVTK
jgi:hypothetical protein